MADLAGDTTSAPSSRRQRAPGMPRDRQDKLFAFALLAPATIAVLILIAYPLVRVVELSLRKGRSMNFRTISDLPLGLDNYVRVLTDPVFWNSVWVSILYVGGSVFFAFLIGLGTALLLNVKFPGRRYFRAAILIPWAVPGVIVAIIFLWMLDSSFGVVNATLRDLSLIEEDIAWFVNSGTALWAVILPTIWKAYPMITLMLLAALQSIPEEIYEAGAIDGANGGQKFWYLTWPGIRGTATLAVLITALWVFRDIDIIYASTQGGPARATETLAVMTYNEAFQYFRMGVASAIGTIMVTAALLATVTAIMLLRRDKF
jgi:multiple sugar transport system permease protein